MRTYLVRVAIVQIIVTLGGTALALVPGCDGGDPKCDTGQWLFNGMCVNRNMGELGGDGGSRPPGSVPQGVSDASVTVSGAE
jgi:hypothetical protein